jgi:hypothetical protein
MGTYELETQIYIRILCYMTKGSSLDLRFSITGSLFQLHQARSIHNIVIMWTRSEGRSIGTSFVVRFIMTSSTSKEPEREAPFTADKGTLQSTSTCVTGLASCCLPLTTQRTNENKASNFVKARNTPKSTAGSATRFRP